MEKSQIKRLKGRPFYCFLYAKNVLGGRLPEELEWCLADEPWVAYQYAKQVGMFCEAVHNRLILGSYNKEQMIWVRRYLEEFESTGTSTTSATAC
jgi:hypothetical protein